MRRVHIHYDLSPLGIAALEEQTGRRAWREQGPEAEVTEDQLGDLFFATSADGTLYTDVYGVEFDAPRTVPQLLDYLRMHHLVDGEDGRRWVPR